MSYTLIEQTNKDWAHLEFNGPFQGKMVVWDTFFFTLDGYASEKNIEYADSKQFIEIQAINNETMKLTIALNISEINIPNIQKMMIMIKQYKNLSLGRHEYGNNK